MYADLDEFNPLDLVFKASVRLWGILKVIREPLISVDALNGKFGIDFIV
jgi:hypothetical protein